MNIITIIIIAAMQFITMELSQRSSHILFLVALSVAFVNGEIRYIILPSTNGAACPSTSNCIILSHISENDYTLKSGSDITLLFLPGNHTLTATLTVNNFSSIIMMSNKSLPRPVINCEHSAQFHFLSSSYVRIDGLNLNGCFNNRVFTVGEFIIKDSKMLGNLRNVSEGALTVTGSKIIAIGNVFESFHSALRLLQSSAYITKCNFMNNRALTKGGALYMKDCYNFTIEHSTFSFHACNNISWNICTGAVMYSTHSELLIINCTLNNNKNGAIAVEHSEMKIFNSFFSENVAQHGAAIQAYRSSLTVIDTHFCYNEVDFDYYKRNVYTLAMPGGAIHCRKCKVEIIRGIFEHNKCVALLGFRAQIKIKSCRFSHNTAAELGGGIYATVRTNIEISGITLFENNVANYGAAFHSFYSTISIVGKISIVNNTANLGAIGIIHSTAVIRANVIFSGNIGSFYMYSGEVSIIPYHSEKVNFTCTGNYQSYTILNEEKYVGSEFLREGGAITLFVSRLELRTTTILSHNIASNGGGIMAITSTIVCSSTLVISNNSVTDTGGGIYLYQSELSVFRELNISNNRAEVCGGGVHAISAFLKLIRRHPRLRSKGTMSLESNFAKQCGGGAFFETGSKMNILRYNLHTVRFTKNTADYGGAIYVADDTNIGMCFSGQKHTLTAATQSECFFQLASVTNPKNNLAIITDAFDFSTNRANRLGADLFGGLLDRCTVNSYSKNLMVKYSSIQGFANNIEQTSTSKPVRVCLCNSSNHVVCGLQPITMRVKKDKVFAMHVAAVDQLNHMVNGTIHSYVRNNLGTLGEGQYLQRIGSHCDNITFSIISPKQYIELVTYVEGPCKDLGISPLRVPITFIPCHCPQGFEQNKVIKNKCICICHQKLKRVSNELDCNSTTLLIHRNSNFWISFTTNETLLTAKICPSDYCLSSTVPVHMNLSDPEGPDIQCKFNRSGLLCGACKIGLTLSIGSSRCVSCPHYWPALFLIILVSAILAGLAVVILMLALNLTVAKGTLNGLIFYSNIIAANQGLFLQFDHPNFLSIFIAWLNLDLGFDVCFVKGLDTYFKVWLQLAFPTYLILLLMAIILISRHSIRFARLISKRNPVAMLATLILLSYSRLLQIIINIFSYTTLCYTPMNDNGHFEAVWLPDASIPYLSGRHIPLFILAILILAIGVAYTLGLIAWQWLVRLPDIVVFKWIKSVKLTSFMDAYHAPYVTKNRYWTGLLLLARVTLYLIAAINVSGEPRFNLLAISLIIGSIFLLHAYSGMNTYKQWVLNVLEFTTYFNILALAIATFYVLQINGDGTTVTLVSIGVQFVLSVCAMMYHIAVETNIMGRMKKSGWYQQQFRLELTAHLLQNETEPLASSQEVTFSEVTISDSKDQLVPYSS